MRGLRRRPVRPEHGRHVAGGVDLAEQRLALAIGRRAVDDVDIVLVVDDERADRVEASSRAGTIGDNVGGERARDARIEPGGYGGVTGEHAHRAGRHVVRVGDLDDGAGVRIGDYRAACRTGCRHPGIRLPRACRGGTIRRIADVDRVTREERPLTPFTDAGRMLGIAATAARLERRELHLHRAGPLAERLRGLTGHDPARTVAP